VLCFPLGGFLFVNFFTNSTRRFIAAKLEKSAVRKGAFLNLRVHSTLGSHHIVYEVNMKKNTTVFLICILMGTGCANPNYKFPTEGAQETIEFEAGKYKFENNEYDTKFGTIVLSENRKVENSRKISLPLIWIPSKSVNKKPPIFILNGGPGTSNMSLRPPEYLLQEHDLVRKLTPKSHKSKLEVSVIINHDGGHHEEIEIFRKPDCGNPKARRAGFEGC
jgi:hypothetical protein